MSRNNLTSIMLVIGCCTFFVNSPADVHKWTDEHGVVHYSDHKPSVNGSRSYSSTQNSSYKAGQGLRPDELRRLRTIRKEERRHREKRIQAYRMNQKQRAKRDKFCKESEQKIHQWRYSRNSPREDQKAQMLKKRRELGC